MSKPELLIILFTPVITSVAGGLTNLAGLLLAFFPIRFVGRRPYWGWQGLIPAKAEVMASKAFDLLTGQLELVDTILDRLDADALAGDVMPAVQRLLDEVLDEVLTREIPRTWMLVQGPIRQELQRRIRREVGPVVAQMIREIKSDLHSAVDLKRVVVDALAAEPRLMNRIFFRAGRRELRLLVLGGFAFGALYGICEAAVALAFEPGPVFYVAGGCIAGALASASALWRVFNPVEPVRIGGFTLQGLFPRRQKAVAAEIARFAAEEVVDLPRIVRLLFKGPAAHVLSGIIERNVKQAFGEFTGDNERLLRVALGRETLEKLPAALAAELAAKGYHAGREALPYLANTIALESLLRARIESLAPRDFEAVLRPVFQHEEVKLVAAGAAVGLAAGALQALLLVFAAGS